MITPLRTRQFTFSLMLIGLSTQVLAQGPAPDYDFDWVTIGAVGNRPANQSEAPRFHPPYENPALAVGAVNYQFRIARTEVTTEQWFEFANAYWPYWEGSYASAALTGRWIFPRSNTPGEDPDFYISEGAERRPTDTSWVTALAYCNWLHNDKRTDEQAFLTGAYDVSGISRNPDGTWNLPQSHLPGARFWLPTLDEWTKALYYDPNKDGPGLDGYWRYPISSDEAPIPGYPWEGGQTTAGISGPVIYLDVGSYHDVQSPWGLFDGSGSQAELLETSFTAFVAVKGTAQFSPNPGLFDRVDHIGGRSPDVSGTGLRIASIVPSQSHALWFIIILNPMRRKRRAT